jgi:hypothetical protein
MPPGRSSARFGDRDSARRCRAPVQRSLQAAAHRSRRMWIQALRMRISGVARDWRGVALASNVRWRRGAVGRSAEEGPCRAGFAGLGRLALPRGGMRTYGGRRRGLLSLLGARLRSSLLLGIVRGQRRKSLRTSLPANGGWAREPAPQQRYRGNGGAGEAAGRRVVPDSNRGGARGSPYPEGASREAGGHCAGSSR